MVLIYHILRSSGFEVTHAGGRDNGSVSVNRRKDSESLSSSAKERSHHFDARRAAIVSLLNLRPIVRAGKPSTIAYGATFPQTTAPGLMMAPIPIDSVGGRMIALWPIQTPCPIVRLPHLIR